MAKATKAKATPKKASEPVSVYSGLVEGLKGLNYEQRRKFFDEAGKIHTTEQQLVGNGGDADGAAYDDLQARLDKE